MNCLLFMNFIICLSVWFESALCLPMLSSDWLWYLIDFFLHLINVSRLVWTQISHHWNLIASLLVRTQYKKEIISVCKNALNWSKAQTFQFYLFHSIYTLQKIIKKRILCTGIVLLKIKWKMYPPFILFHTFKSLFFLLNSKEDILKMLETCNLLLYYLFFLFWTFFFKICSFLFNRRKKGTKILIAWVWVNSE